MIYAELGEISSGTMRNADLIPVLTTALSNIVATNGRAGYQATTSVIATLACANLMESLLDQTEGDALADDLADTEAASELVQEIFDALQEYAPPFATFGALEGDGACYGFWVHMDSIEEEVRDGTMLKLEAGTHAPDDWDGYVLFVNDHGNCTLQTIAPAITHWELV